MIFSAEKVLKFGLLLTALYPLQAYAAAINGTVCEVSASAAGDAHNAATMNPAVSPCAQFTTTDINYDQQGQTSFDTFLNNPAFFNQTNGFSGSDLYSNFLIELTGSTFLHAGSNAFVVAHDDGVELNIAGIGNVVDAPGPTSENDTAFNVNAPADGLYGFTLDYAECCGPPAVLKFNVNDLPVGTPEPVSCVLVGTGLALVAVIRRKRAA